MRRLVLLLTAIAALPACDRLPGRPTEAERFVRPDAVTSFADLYAANCAGCHGDDGRGGAAQPLRDPLYLAVVPADALRRVIAEGVPGTMMPAFAAHHGGPLTDEQVGLLVDGMRSRWADPDGFVNTRLPRWTVSPGDVRRGARVFASACARCHGADGTGGSAGSVVDPWFLALSSDQALRTNVIAGRPDLGQPDFRTVDPSGPLNDRQIDDLVAWLASHRHPE